MAAVYRDVPPIVISEGETSDIEGKELKDDGGTKEDLYVMKNKGGEEKAAQAGGCLVGKDLALLCHAEEEQASLIGISKESGGEEAKAHSCLEEEDCSKLRRWMKSVKKQVKANRKVRENTEDYLDARYRAKRHRQLKRTQKKLKAALRGTRRAPVEYGRGMEAVSYTHLTLPTKRIV